MSWADEAEVVFESGRGGDGAASMHREKHVPRGGPNGADGGRGGDVILVADRSVRTLFEFRLRNRFKAGDGTDAVGAKSGRDGSSLQVRVPVGTVVTEVGDDEPTIDLHAHGMSFVIARGGRGGHGNRYYTNSVRQAPTFAERGAPGDTVRVRLEIKLLADVGLIGLPNAGKSTVVGAVSAARPKVGAYPFTTVVPNLGVVELDGQTFVIADMPGLIEGASRGVGLGHRFLRHIERTRVLVHVVDLFPIDETDPLENFETVEREIALYSPVLAARPRLVALNKTDLGTPEAARERQAKFARVGYETFLVSGATGDGLRALLYRCLALIKEAEAVAEPVILRPFASRRIEGEWDVVREESCYVVSGRRVERLVEMTDLTNSEAIRFLHRKLARIGVIGRLREHGATEGDQVVVGDRVFTFTDWE